jgi:hypothetical protein
LSPHEALIIHRLSINHIKAFDLSVQEDATLPKRYVNIKLPVELADEVDKIVDKKLLGYRSRGEFVAEAVRDKLIQLKK